MSYQRNYISFEGNYYLYTEFPEDEYEENEIDTYIKYST